MNPQRTNKRAEGGIKNDKRCSPGQGSVCERWYLKTMHLRLTFFLNTKSWHWHTSWTFMLTSCGNGRHTSAHIFVCARELLYSRRERYRDLFSLCNFLLRYLPVLLLSPPLEGNWYVPAGNYTWERERGRHTDTHSPQRRDFKVADGYIAP